MYSIQFSDWGLVLQFMGRIDAAVMRDWLTDVRQLTDGFIEPFSVIVDVQGVAPTGHAVEAIMLEGLRALEQAGMVRVALVAGKNSAVRWSRVGSRQELTTLRRFVATDESDWLIAAHAWVQRGIDPASDEARASA